MLKTTLRTDIEIVGLNFLLSAEEQPHYKDNILFIPEKQDIVIPEKQKSITVVDVNQKTDKWYNNHKPNITPKHAEMLREINDNGTRIFVCSGGGGTGKTTELQCIVENSNCLPEECVVVASTNKAADLLKERGFYAETLHALLGSQISKNDEEYDALLKIKYYQTFEELLKGKKSKFYDRFVEKFKDIKFFILDEISMVSDDYVKLMFSILKEFMHEDGIIILSGDYMQLDPVSGLSSCDRILKMKNDNELYVLHFDIRYRSFQATMNTKCTYFRDGTLKDEKQFNYFCNYLKTIKRLKTLNSSNVGEFVDYTFLTYKNKKREDINKLYFDYFGGTKYKSKEIVVRNSGPSKEVLDEIRASMTFDRIFEFKIGMHVMFCATYYVNRDYTNGEHGIIDDLTTDDDGEVLSIFVKKTSNQTGQLEIIEVFKQDFMVDLLKKVSGYDVLYRQFPLVLAHAMTIHKSQGSGYKKLIIDLGSIDRITKNMYMTQEEADTLRCKLFYTALTRTEDTDHLYFYGISDSFFDTKKYPSGKEYRRSALKHRYVDVIDHKKLTLK